MAWFTGWKRRPVWTIAAAVFCLFWLVSSRYTGPAYLSDEIGYLGHAALLAGYVIDGASSWHAGYSLLLAPLFRVFSEPGQIWQAVMALNAAMWAASFLMLMHMVARFFPDHTTSRRILAVAVAAAYPTWLTMSGYAFPTTAIVLVFMISVITAVNVNLQHPWSVIPHSLAVGFLYWVHPTGLAVAAASTLTLAIVTFRKTQFVSLSVHIALVTILIVVYSQGLHPWLLDVGTAPGFPSNEHYQSYASVLPHFARPEFWFRTAVAALGQLSYLTIGSFGLAVFGFVQFVRLAREHLQGTSSKDVRGDGAIGYTSLFVLLSIVGVIFMGSAGFSASDSTPRVDQWIYGRYDEGVLLPFLAIGFLADSRRRWLPLLAGGLLACGALLAVTTAPVKTSNLVTTISFWPQYLVEAPNYLLWMAVGALGVFVFQVARQEGRVGKTVALSLLIGACVLSDLNGQLHHDYKLEMNEPTGFVGIVRESFEPGSCVGFNPEMSADAVLFQRQRFQLHLFYLYDYAYQRMYVGDWLKTCDGPLLTYDVDELRDIPGVVLLGQEVRSGLYVVAKDRDEGFLIPTEALTERTFYRADGWSLRQDLYCYGQSLTRLPSQVGSFRDSTVVSTGRAGFLVYGPNVAMSAGEYRLVVSGSAPVVASAFVDVVSGVGNEQHARSALSATTGDATGVLASGHVFLDRDVVDLEVRVYVGSDDAVRLTGYELVPADSAPASSPQRAVE